MNLFSAPVIAQLIFFMGAAWVIWVASSVRRLLEARRYLREYRQRLEEINEKLSAWRDGQLKT